MNNEIDLALASLRKKVWDIQEQLNELELIGSCDCTIEFGEDGYCENRAPCIAKSLVSELRNKISRLSAQRASKDSKR